MKGTESMAGWCSSVSAVMSSVEDKPGAQTPLIVGAWALESFDDAKMAS